MVASLLGLPRVGLNDNFFYLGGNSLFCTQVIARLRPRLAKVEGAAPGYRQLNRHESGRDREAEPCPFAGHRPDYGEPDELVADEIDPGIHAVYRGGFENSRCATPMDRSRNPPSQ